MIRWIVLQRGGTLQERVPTYLRFTLTCPPSEQEGTACLRLRFISPTGVAKSFAWLSLYAYPAGTSFCSCASSRAALHVGSLFLRNRQPSNAPPLLLSPTGRATRRGPQMQNTLGGTPRPQRTGTPARNGCAVPKRGLNGAYKVSATHFYRPRAGARRANHHPSPLLKGGELWGQWAITFRAVSLSADGR